MTKSDLDAALACGADIVNLSIAVSDQHINQKLRCDRAWVLNTVDIHVRRARDAGARVAVGCEDASRADPDFVLRVAEVAENAGAERLRFADTLGVLDPFATFSRISQLAGRTGIDTRRFPEISALVAKASGRAVAPNKSIVGQGVFSHESGIHVDGMLKDPANYQGFDPELVGRQHCLVLGKHSSSRGVIHAYAGLGIEIDEQLAQNILAQVRRFAVTYKRSPAPADLKHFHTLALPEASTTGREVCHVA